MDKQKAIQIIKDAPVDWGFYNELTCSFFARVAGIWYIYEGSWIAHNPHPKAYASMMPKAEILKIAECEEVKYPAILKNTCKRMPQTVIAYSKRLALHIEGEFKGEVSARYNVSNTVNITHNFLANTYGEVVSPEHAEFIIELGKNAKAEISTEYSKGSFFNFYTSSDDELHLNFFDEHLAKDSGEKQITIPLPPKSEPLKNAGDNLVLGCESQLPKSNAKAEMPSTKEFKGDEWPKISGEVLTTDNNKGILIVSKPDDHGMVVVECKSHDYGKFYRVVRLSDLSKPKTPEEELFDAFWREVGLFMNQSNLNKGIFKASFINNITKKPQ